MPLKYKINDLLALYRSELLERTIPFWTKNAIDQENGGLLTCISDEGKILSYDKYMWSQMRAIWVFSAMYNKIEPRQDWLDIALHIYDFASKHGRDEKGQWMFSVDKNGKPLQGATSIYADGFAIAGLIELVRATGKPDILDLALSTYENVQSRLALPGSYRTDPYELPKGVKTHGISMIFANAFNELGQFLISQDIIDASLYHVNEVMQVFLRPERQMLFEFVTLDNELIDSPQGRAVVPGHVIESMWMMIHILQKEKDDVGIKKAIEALKWHLELGWDKENGGLFLGRDAEGKKPWWKFADTKLWWPHTEALYALLLAYHISGENWCMEWYERVHDYAFSHYPVEKYGEWTQKLDRKGNKITDTVALPVKDPFHLPRALILSIGVLQKMQQAL